MLVGIHHRLDERLMRLIALSRDRLQGIFWDVFYTKPKFKIITKSLETSKLSGKVNILPN